MSGPGGGSCPVPISDINAGASIELRARGQGRSHVTQMTLFLIIFGAVFIAVLMTLPIRALLMNQQLPRHEVGTKSSKTRSVTTGGY